MKSRALLMSLLGVLAVPAANAVVIETGHHGSTTDLLGVVAPGSFSDDFSFNISSTSDMTDHFYAPKALISGFSYQLEASNGTKIGGVDQKSFSDLSAGSYQWVFSGLTTSKFLPVGIYFGSYATSVAAVPEPDTWMMLLVGAGLVAYQLRRKQKSLLSGGSLSHS